MTREQVAHCMGEKELAPGIYGQIFDTPDGIYIPVITSDKPGDGNVGRYIDGLPRNRDVKFPTVISLILRGMLLRRGFVDTFEFSEEFGENVDLMVRKASANEVGK